jgi:hypothetical protein
VSEELNILIISSLVRVLHSLFMYFGPHILLKIFFSHVAKMFSSFLVKSRAQPRKLHRVWLLFYISLF